MANKPGRTGRDGEHKVVAYLEEAGFQQIEREGKRAASLDVVGGDLTVPIEVKRRKTLDVPGWTRQVATRHGETWALFIIQRDARKNVHPDMMVVPAAMGASMLRLWELAKSGELFVEWGAGAYGECNHDQFKEIA